MAKPKPQESAAEVPLPQSGGAYRLDSKNRLVRLDDPEVSVAAGTTEPAAPTHHNEEPS